MNKEIPNSENIILRNVFNQFNKNIETKTKPIKKPKVTENRERKKLELTPRKEKRTSKDKKDGGDNKKSARSSRKRK